jgi:hypothetical protein
MKRLLSLRAKWFLVLFVAGMAILYKLQPLFGIELF